MTRTPIGALRLFGRLFAKRAFALVLLLAAASVAILPVQGQPRVAARVDRYGDPLPAGVVRRFGTLRLRNCNAVAFTPDGKQVVTSGGTTHAEVVFWDRSSGKEMRRLQADASIRRLLFAPDGKTLAAMTARVYANPVWDVASGKVRFPFRGEEGTFTTDGGTVLSEYDGKTGPTIGAWEVMTGKESGEWTMPAKAAGICCSPDGKTVAYALGEALVLYDLGTRTETRRLSDTRKRNGPMSGQTFSFSPDGKHVAAASLRGLRVWNVATGREAFAWDRLVDSVVCFSADGKQLAWTGYDARSGPYARVAALGQGEPRRLGLPINNLSSQLAFAPDGKTLAVISAAGAVELRDVATGKDALPLDANTGRIFGLELSPDGRFLATRDIFRVLVWETASGKLLRRFPDEGGVKSDEPFTVWDVRLGADGQLRRGNATNLQGHWEEHGPAALAKLQKLGLKDGTAPAFAGFQGTIPDVLASRDGRYVAVRLSAQRPGVIDRLAQESIRVWDTRTGQRLHQVRPTAGLSQQEAAQGPYLGAFSPDNRLLATTSRRGTIHLWDLATGKERLRLRGHPACIVESLLFTADNRFLLSGGYDSQVLQWDLTGRAIAGVWRTVRLEPKQRLELWQRLGAPDAAAASKALWELAADPEGTVAFLRGRVKPVARADGKVAADLVARLDADSFVTRQDAEATLRSMGEGALPAMRGALAKPRSLEQARRLEKLLQALALSALAGEPLRSFRAVEILERIATPAARRLLGELAGGLPGARLTTAAQEALERLDAR